MVSCPECRERLSGGPQRYGANMICNRCGGRTLDMAWIRDSGSGKIVDWLLAPSRQDQPRNQKPCPLCGIQMVGIPLPLAGEDEIIPVCARCHLVWLRPPVLYRISRDYPEVDPVIDNLHRHPGVDGVEPEFSPESIRKLSERQLAAKVGQPSKPATIESPEKKPETEKDLRAKQKEPVLKSGWQVLPGLLGMPLEGTSHRVISKPYATWILAGAITVVSIWSISSFESTIYRFGWIPALWWRYGGLTLLTSFFLHGGLMHWAGNLYFLLVFGDNAEDYLGRRRYLLLVLLSTIAGNLLHSLAAADWFEPAIGASGGISGIIIFYGLIFPRARLTVLAQSLFFFPIRFNAFTGMCVWALYQFLVAIMQLLGGTNVSGLAHLGGGVVGLVYGLIYLARRKSFQV
jgi:membrane associated rhomboid family serine protease